MDAGIDAAVLAAPTTRPTSRRALLAGPLACGCALVGAAVYVAVADPTASGTHLPGCPLYELTGIYCPGCGLTRATHSLLRGNLRAALGYNLLLPFFLAAIALAWFGWLRAALGRAPARWTAKLSARTGAIAIVVLVVFGVLRNLAPFHALAP
ncbi:MAG: hypothetical protein JWN39_2479 [Ilumatobacteraceae bacterium]|nr:hypothetical protein [Ilumatobacteraceae bacterium]